MILALDILKVPKEFKIERTNHNRELITIRNQPQAYITFRGHIELIKWQTDQNFCNQQFRQALVTSFKIANLLDSRSQDIKRSKFTNPHSFKVQGLSNNLILQTYFFCVKFSQNQVPEFSKVTIHFTFLLIGFLENKRNEGFRE